MFNYDDYLEKYSSSIASVLSLWIYEKMRRFRIITRDKEHNVFIARWKKYDFYLEKVVMSPAYINDNANCEKYKNPFFTNEGKVCSTWKTLVAFANQVNKAPIVFATKFNTINTSIFVTEKHFLHLKQFYRGNYSVHYFNDESVPEAYEIPFYHFKKQLTWEQFTGF